MRHTGSLHRRHGYPTPAPRRPSNPRTVEEARAFVKHVESLFMPWNIDALVDGFTDDCVVRFGTLAGTPRA